VADRPLVRYAALGRAAARPYQRPDAIAAAPSPSGTWLFALAVAALRLRRGPFTARGPTWTVSTRPSAS
jgi:hypothetical protein